MTGQQKRAEAAGGGSALGHRQDACGGDSGRRVRGALGGERRSWLFGGLEGTAWEDTRAWARRSELAAWEARSAHGRRASGDVSQPLRDRALHEDGTPSSPSAKRARLAAKASRRVPAQPPPGVPARGRPPLTMAAAPALLRAVPSSRVGPQRAPGPCCRVCTTLRASHPPTQHPLGVRSDQGPSSQREALRGMCDQEPLWFHSKPGAAGLADATVERRHSEGSSSETPPAGLAPRPLRECTRSGLMGVISRVSPAHASGHQGPEAGRAPPGCWRRPDPGVLRLVPKRGPSGQTSSPSEGAQVPLGPQRFGYCPSLCLFVSRDRPIPCTEQPTRLPARNLSVLQEADPAPWQCVSPAHWTQTSWVHGNEGDDGRWVPGLHPCCTAAPGATQEPTSLHAQRKPPWARLSLRDRPSLPVPTFSASGESAASLSTAPFHASSR